ncbi:MAG: dihydroorotate dehydrogenase-like protein [Phycisphaerales bacterium]|nr:dihydroorotate dehydrogenase-like protein [Phycisphaerales bacterium]
MAMVTETIDRREIGTMDLSTTYMGLKLKNPLMPSASPLTSDISMIRRLEDEGASSLVLYSLFEEQIAHDAAELDHHLTHGSESYTEALSYFPEATGLVLGPEEYLAHIEKAKRAVDIPVIASLNGASVGGWTEYARKIEQAGADALELNVYYIATDPTISGAEVEARYLGILSAIKSAVNLPVAVKLGPYFSSMAWMAQRLDEAGANALVLFNRFYQPDIDLDELEVVPNLILSSTPEMRLPLRWVAILHGRLKASLAATTGIHSASDVLKIVMAGADVAQLCSVLLKRGPGEISVILREVQMWMEEKEYESINQMKGSMSQKSCPDPASFERANYMSALHNYV